MRKYLVLGALWLAACGTKELHVITPIPRMLDGAASTTVVVAREGRGRKDPAPPQMSAAPTGPGAWVARSTYEIKTGLFSNQVHLKAIEVLYCPHGNNALECRLGVAWSESRQALALAYPPLPRLIPDAEPVRVQAPVAAPPPLPQLQPQPVKVQVECTSKSAPPDPGSAVLAAPRSESKPQVSEPASEPPSAGGEEGKKGKRRHGR